MSTNVNHFEDLVNIPLICVVLALPTLKHYVMKQVDRLVHRSSNFECAVVLKAFANSDSLC